MNAHPGSQHCLQCGAALSWQVIAGRPRQVCPACGWVYYQHLKVGAGTRLVVDGRLLLLRRAIQPYQDAWNLPAGFVEADEHPRRAAERETLEETGLQVRATTLVDVYFFDDDPRGAGLLILYDCELSGGALHGGDGESAEGRFFAPHELPTELARGGHDQAIRAWQAAYGS